jgi:hypothetical protein
MLAFSAWRGAATVQESPAGLLALDQQLAAYSWVTGGPEVAFVVFVRKPRPEVQYLSTTITEEQRKRFAALLEETIERIESAHFLPRSGIRFPQNGCMSCSYLGLCLGNQQLAASQIVRRPGGEELGWLDEISY